MRLTVAVFSAAVLFGAGLPAAAAELNPPLLGYVFHPGSGKLAPIRGVPGAAMVEPELPGVEAYSSATASPAGGTAIAVNGDGTVYLLRLSAGAVAAEVLPVSPAPSRIAWSPSGVAAALLHDTFVEVVTNLSDSPRTNGPVSLPDAATGPLAVSDDGAAVLAAVRAADNTARVVRLRGGASDGVLSGGVYGAIAFRAQSGDAAVAGGGAVTLIRDAATNPSLQVLVENDPLVDGSLSLAFSSDGSRLLAAAGAASVVKVFPLAGGDPLAVSCNCHPALLDSMYQRDVFRVSGPGDPVLMLLDLGAAAPRFVFVPPAPAEGLSGGGR